MKLMFMNRKRSDCEFLRVSIVSKILSQYSGAVDLILHANVLREAAEASFAMEILRLLEGLR